MEKLTGLKSYVGVSQKEVARTVWNLQLQDYSSSIFDLCISNSSMVSTFNY